ncbi:hypothetical protein TNCV_2052731 [Trichonephila clavipes]|nr:hypothetical protein TNCV_2052731 [Trichonephila clavipes]
MWGGAPSCIKIMRERHSRSCRCGIILFPNNDAYRCPVIEHVIGFPAPNSSKKYGPRIKDAENPHHTVNFGECSGTQDIPRPFWINFQTSKKLVRTHVESRNHVGAIPAQIEACMDGGCFA